MLTLTVNLYYSTKKKGWHNITRNVKSLPFYISHNIINSTMTRIVISVFESMHLVN